MKVKTASRSEERRSVTACTKPATLHAPRSDARTLHVPQAPRASAYLMTEALVYIGVLFLLLGAGYAALYRCIDSSAVLRRNADDISRALRAGERWRADVRKAGQTVQFSESAEGQLLHLEGAGQQVDYRFSSNCVQRRHNAGQWITVLERVKTSAMQSEARQNLIAWRWELELQPQAKGSARAAHLRPLFTFLAAPATPSKP